MVEMEGFVDRSGRYVIESKFDYAGDFFEGLAWVCIDDQYGYIDKIGRFVIPSRYDDALDFSEGLAAVEFDGKWGYINKEGQFVIPPKFDSACSFSGGRAAIKINGKWGYIDKSGKTIVVPTYDEVLAFHEGMACVACGRDLNKMCGYIGLDGHLRIPLIYKYTFFNANYSGGLARVILGNTNKVGYIDKSGRVVLNTTFEKAGEFHEGLAWVSSKSEKGYIDKSGKFVFRIDTEWGVSSFSEGFAQIVVKGRYGFINKAGQVVIEPTFDYAGDFRKDVFHYSGVKI